MTKRLPALYGLSTNRLEETWNWLREKGYNESDIVNKTRKLPGLYSYPTESLEETWNWLGEKGYNESGIVNMTRKIPNLYVYSMNRLENTWKTLSEYLPEQELKEIIKNKPEFFIPNPKKVVGYFF